MLEPEEIEGSSDQMISRLLCTVIRQRWLIIGTTCAVTLSVIGFLFHIPNEYTSDATILVDAQKVSERYVVPTTSADASHALEAMENEVLSRPRLLAIIDELGLYPEQKQRLAPEELIALMREHFSIEAFVKPGERIASTFQISFTASSPQLAQHVTTRLSALFIEQNLKTRTDQAITTTAFLHEQLELTKTKLAAQEERLRDFKMQYLGELPEQRDANVAILRGLESQMADVMSTRNQALQQRSHLQSLLTDHSRRELTRLQAERRKLLMVFTSQHPDVLRNDQEISNQQKLVNELNNGVTAPLKQGQLAELARTSEASAGVSQFTSQLQTNAFDVDTLVKKEQTLRAEVDKYRSRLNLMPVREQQVTSLQRDYDLLRQHYGDLLKKEQESQLATNLEKRQEGQQFRLADPPNLPTRPSKPRRLKLSFGALIGGLVAGGALALLNEMRRPSFHAESETASLELPIVIGIPLFMTPTEKRSRALKRNFEWCAGVVLLCAVVTAEYFVYRHG